ncbi:nitroreductase family protein [Acidaminobacterium chupaoyuni]
MELTQLVHLRESCRHYLPRPVEREKLEACLECAHLAPSACNSQPWHFTVVTNPELVKKVAPCLQEMGMNGFASQAPAFIIINEEKAALAATVASKMKSQDYAQMDIGIATAHLVLAAAQQGLGTCILGWFNEKKLKQLLEMPEEKRIRLVIAVGYSADEAPRPKKRKPSQEIIDFRD